MILPKLRMLPPPEWLLRPVPARLQGYLLQALLQRILGGSDTAAVELRSLAGKCIVFCTPDRVMNLALRITERGISVAPAETVEADCTICGDLIALSSLCLNLEDADSLFFSRRLLLTGDTACGLRFKNILTAVETHPREMLERRLGAGAADLLWRAGGRMVDRVVRLDALLAAAASRFEQKMCQNLRAELESANTRLNTLVEEHSALQRRLSRLERRVSARGRTEQV